MNREELIAELQAAERQLEKAEREIRDKYLKTVCIPMGVSATAIAETLAQSSISAGIDGAQSIASARALSLSSGKAGIKIGG